MQFLIPSSYNLLVVSDRSSSLNNTFIASLSQFEFKLKPEAILAECVRFTNCFIISYIFISVTLKWLFRYV